MAFRFTSEDFERYVKQEEHGGVHIWNELQEYLHAIYGIPFSATPYHPRGDWLQKIWFAPKETPRDMWSNQAQFFLARDIEQKHLDFGLMIERASPYITKEWNLDQDRDGMRLRTLLEEDAEFAQQIDRFIETDGSTWIVSVYEWEKRTYSPENSEALLTLLQGFPNTQGWSVTIKKRLTAEEAVAMDEDIGAFMAETYEALRPIWQRVIPVADREVLGRCRVLNVTPKEGVWLFQANPTQYNLADALQEIEVGAMDRWSVTRYRTAMQPGAFVLLWQSGEEAGVYAIAELTSVPYQRDWDIDDSTVAVESYERADWWVDVQYLWILDAPLTRAVIKADPGLKTLGVLTFPQATNYKVAPDEWAAVRALLSNAPKRPTIVRDRAAPDEPTPVACDVMACLTRAFQAQGLHFTPWQIATFYTALQTKGLLILSGISGTGKTKLAQTFAGLLPDKAKGTSDISDQEHMLFLPVRPDWRDSKSLLGYYNPLLGTYEWTLFLRFLGRAAQSYHARDGRAWFVILDEMNLARVEYYFADLLSVLESGRDAEGWTREPLRMTYPKDAKGPLPPQALHLPPNLYIIGTVNVDETTHAFSPKVLDRAFTLDLTDVDFSQYPPPADRLKIEGGALSGAERQALLEDFTAGGRFVRIDKSAIAAYIQAHPQVRAYLRTLTALLRPYHLHFGYRVFDEIVAFLVKAQATTARDDLYAVLPSDPMLTALDAAVLMKVLPKFHGSRGKLEQPLKHMLAWCLNPANPDPTVIDNSLREAEAPDEVVATLSQDTYRCPRTAARARRMLWALYTSGFAAFG